MVRELVDKIPQEATLEGQRAQEIWLIFKDNLFRAEQCVLMGRKLRTPGRRDEELLAGLQHKRKHTEGKHGDRLPRRSTETYPGHAGPEPGMPNVHWGQNR